MSRFLVIQTAFIGDVVLATAIVEKIHAWFPDARIDFLLRKGNESLLKHHPFLDEVIVWDKKGGKYKNLWKILKHIRRNQYDKVINVQRFAATGLLTIFSGAKEKIGFDKNPFSWGFDVKVPHIIAQGGKAKHEVERNMDLIRHFTDDKIFKPKLYPSLADEEAVAKYKRESYVCIAPASVWFTKQFPADKWISFIKKIPAEIAVYLLGAPGEKELCELIARVSGKHNLYNLAGKLSFLQSASLMESALMNYVNDSAPLHFASAVNAPVSAVYCSTIPDFGFGPLSDKSYIIEVLEQLDCRPCGLHGKKACPLTHFHCAYFITDEQLLATLHK